MTRPISYNDALEDCLNVMQTGGDLRGTVARYPQYDAQLRDDVRLAYGLRRAAVRVVPNEGAEIRASLRLTNALREARAEAVPSRRAGGFGWLTRSLRPLAIAGIAAVLIVFGLGATGSLSNPLGGAKGAEAATVEGVVVDNQGGTLTLETAQGLTKVDLNQKPTIQDAEAKLLTISDLEAGQIVRVKAKKTPQGALIAKQVDRKAMNLALQDWCADNGDACHEVAPRLDALTNQCRPGDQQCQRIQQTAQDLQKALKALTQRITDLKNRCSDNRDAGACRQLMQVCKDHPIVCADLKVRPVGRDGNNAGPGYGNGNQRPEGGPGKPGGNGNGPKSH